MAKKFSQFISNNLFWIALITALLAFIFAIKGFIQLKLFKYDSLEDYIETLYYILLLFSLQTLPIHPSMESLPIKLAKVLGPISFILFSVKTFFLLLSEQLVMLKLKKYRNHIVICGLNLTGIFFIKDKSERKMKVSIVTDSYDNKYISTCKEMKLPIIIGDFSNIDILKASKFERAKEIYLISEDDIKNIEIAKRIKNILIEKKDRKERKIYLHVNNYDLKVNTQNENWLTTGIKHIEIELFNIYELAARDILRKISIEPDGKNVVTVENPWVILYGFNSMANALVKQIIKLKSYLSGKKLKITIVDKKIDTAMDLFFSQFCNPKCKKNDMFINAEVEFINKELLDIIYEKTSNFQSKIYTPNAIFINSDSDLTTELLINKLKTFLSIDKRGILQESILIVGLYYNNIIKEEVKVVQDNLKIYKTNVIANGCYSLINLSKIDMLPKLIHSHFFVNNFFSDLNGLKLNYDSKLAESIINSDKPIFQKEQEIRTEFKDELIILTKNKPSRMQWHELSENIKNSNRFQADHILDKLKVLNPAFSIENVEPAMIKNILAKNNLIDVLAELEYNRFSTEKILLEQPIYYKPFEQIPEEEKNLNREIILFLPILIEEYQRLTKR